jgi:1,4-dihydroxy-2-naphthoyl-CoA hydrolase
MFKSRHTIRFYDADPAGVLFFGRIFQVYHNAYEELISELRGTIGDFFTSSEYAAPIRHAEADYILPIFPGETVEIELQVTDLRTSSFELTGFVRGADGEMKASVKTIHVCVLKKDWNKSPLPDSWRAALELLRAGTE